MILEHKVASWELGLKLAPSVEHTGVDDVGKGGLGIVGDVFLEGFFFEPTFVKGTPAAHERYARAGFAKRFATVFVPLVVGREGGEVAELEPSHNVDRHPSFITYLRGPAVIITSVPNPLACISI